MHLSSTPCHRASDLPRIFRNVLIRARGRSGNCFPGNYTADYSDGIVTELRHRAGNHLGQGAVSCLAPPSPIATRQTWSAPIREGCLAEATLHDEVIGDLAMRSRSQANPSLSRK